MEVRRKRREEFASPGSPFKARPGQEEALEEADDTLFALSVILEELEEAHGKAQEDMGLGHVSWFMDMALVFGLALLGTLGVAAMCIVLHAPDPVVRASAAVGAGTALSLAVKTAGK